MSDIKSRIAAVANLTSYNAELTKNYVDGAPHIKHRALRELYARLVNQVFEHAKLHCDEPALLDLGAGEGSVTLPFLELGARVTAVDISSSQLDALRAKCQRYGDRLQLRCADVNQAVIDEQKKYDVIVANSFLHHVPDYLGMISNALALLKPGGQFFSFQDPLRYDTQGTLTRLYANTAYLSWRIFKGDIVGGLKRRLRRSRGVYLEDSIQDNAEYHVVRNGLDQDAICQLFTSRHFDCQITRYYSTQNALFQWLGSQLGMHTTFAIVARSPAV